MSTELDVSTIDEVQLSGLVLLKIIKHARDNSPNHVAGQLLGLDVGRTLQVTQCFPFPAQQEEDESGDAGSQFQMDMLRCLRNVNMDANTVGMYQSTMLGSYFAPNVISDHFEYQQAYGSRCVCLIYDPLQTAQGSLFIKAIRLKQAFFDMYQEERFTTEHIAKMRLTMKDVFEEVPIRIHNASLVHAYLHTLKEQVVVNNLHANDFDRFDLNTGPFLEKYMEAMVGAGDSLQSDMNRYATYQRNVLKQQQQKQQYLKRRAGKEGGDEDTTQAKTLQEPTRFEPILLSNQMLSYCKQVKGFAAQNVQKMFLLDGLSGGK